MTPPVIANWSLARDIRAFSDNGHLILVIGAARELAGVPRTDLLSGDMVRFHLAAMVDTGAERHALAELHSRLGGGGFWIDDARRVADLADMVQSGRARAVMIARSSLGAGQEAELLRGDEGYLARMQAILALLPAKIGPAAWDELMKVFTPLSLAITLCAIALAISSGVGALVVLGAGIVMVGWSIFDAIGKIVAFCQLFMVADTPREQDRCAELLAQAIAAIGVGAMVALLTRGGARAAQMRRTRTGGSAPQARPRDPLNDHVDPRERARPVRPEPERAPEPARPVRTPRQQGFDDLAAERQRRGLPVAGSADDTHTLSRLQVNGETYYGANSGIQNPRTPITLDRVNAQTRTHAEAEAVQRALNQNGRANGGVAEMWVDRDPCLACGANGGLRSLARNLGVDRLVVHGPSGTTEYLPTR